MVEPEIPFESQSFLLLTGTKYKSTAPPTSQVLVEEVNSEMVTKEAPEVADTATKDDTPNDVILTDEI